MEFGIVKTFYAAYGMNLCDRYMVDQNIKDCFPHDPYPRHFAIIKDYKLTFRGNGKGTGLATIEPCAGSEVPVGLWSISKSKERELDRREGFPTLYRKEWLPVEYDSNGPGVIQIRALVYVMNGDKKLSTPSDYYENIIREGYQNWGLDISFLNRAVAEAEKAV